MMQFSIRLRTTSDREFGRVRNGSWTGLVKALKDGHADMSPSGLSITMERNRWKLQTTVTKDSYFEIHMLRRLRLLFNCKMLLCMAFLL